MNVASLAGYQAMPHMAAYGASKAYVLRFTEAVAEENRQHGLRILAVSPGDTDTPMNTTVSNKKRTAEQVVETTWRALQGEAPSVVDGHANAVLAALTTRVLPTRLSLRIAEKMMRDKA